MGADEGRYLEVVFNLPADKRFWYELPSTLALRAEPGQRVLVPFHNRRAVGFVAGRSSEEPGVKTKTVIDVIDASSPFSGLLWQLAGWLSRYYCCSLGQALHAVYPFQYPVRGLGLAQGYRDLTGVGELAQPGAATLYEGRIDEDLVGRFGDLVSRGGTALLLVPEIEAIEPAEHLLQEAGIQSLSYHSQLTRRQRYEHWNLMREADSLVAVGTRSLVFAPLHRLGLIVMSDESAEGYKQLETPRYHAREVSLKRAELEDCPVLLTSIAPSAKSWYCMRIGLYKHQVPRERQEAARLEVIDLKHEKWRDRVVSPALQERLRENRNKGRRALLFVPRKGFARYVLCSDCRQVLRCPYCGTTLSLLRQSRITCYSCGYEGTPPARCPHCQGTKLQLMGQGTGAIELLLNRLFPKARVERIDLDTYKTRSHRLATQTPIAKADILVGTRRVLKDTVLPDIHLVGVVSVDSLLNLPDFRAAERVYQLVRRLRYLIPEDGLVVVQTYHPDHYAFTAQTNEEFFAAELGLRETLGYPPFERWARILVEGRGRKRVQEECQAIGRQLQQVGLRLLGPSVCPQAKRAGKYRHHMMVRFRKSETDIECLRELREQRRGHSLRIIIDVDPLVTT